MKEKAFRKTLPAASETDWNFSGQNAFDYLYDLSETIGSRLGGTKGEYLAAEYIMDKFRSFGMRTFLHKFPIWTYDNKEARTEARIGKENWKNIPCEVHMPCSSTPKSGITGKLFFAVQGYQEAITPDVKGKIVVMSQGIPKEEREHFLSYKPKALVFIDGRYETHLHRQLTGHDYFASWGSLPTVTIPYLDALPLVEAKIECEMRIKIANEEKYVWGHNVIGEIKGTDFPEEIIVICGHYDTHWQCPGATDNGGGTVIAMELARILAKKRPKRTIRFVLFSGEESGLHGSIAYAHELMESDKKERAKKSFDAASGRTLLERHRLGLNIDVMGSLLANDVILYSGPEDLGASMRLLFFEKKRNLSCSRGPMSSDGTPLAAVGIPVVQYGRYGAGTGFGHTGDDSIKYLSSEALFLSGDICLTWLRRYVVDTPTLPFKRDVSQEDIKKCEDYFQGRRGRDPRFETKRLFPKGDPKIKDPAKKTLE